MTSSLLCARDLFGIEGPGSSFGAVRRVIKIIVGVGVHAGVITISIVLPGAWITGGTGTVVVKQTGAVGLNIAAIGIRA